MIQKFFFPAFLTIWLLMVLCDTAVAFRCGNRLVNIGDSKSEVLRKCGPPSWRDAWEEDRIDRVFGYSYSDGGGISGTRVPAAVVVRITIEEWTYNLGPTQFIRILRFDNSRLVHIETRGYGY